MTKEFNIVINTDDNYLQHAIAMLCSLYDNNKYQLSVHVLHGGLSEKSKDIISLLTKKYNNQVAFYEVDPTPLEGVQFRKNRPLSMAAYYRLLLSSILPESINKVLYLDCDIIVLRDIAEIFELEIDDYALAATLDKFPYSEQHRLQLHMEVGERTFCSGVMLVNLKYWRENNVEPGLLEYAKRHREEVYLHDQDVLNYYFKRKWFLLPPKWNHVAGSLRAPYCPLYKTYDRLAYSLKPVLYHFASLGIKPWYKGNIPEKECYLKYLKLSDYKDIKFEEKSLGFRFKMFNRTNIYYFKKWLQKRLLSNRITYLLGVKTV